MKTTSVEIIEILKNAGHEAYWAGGCVRDMLLGIEPKDFDIVTSAKPDEIEALLEHTVPIGKKFGVILAIKGKYTYEIATFRSDSGYSDGRRPDAVQFTDAKQDAFRRDFTINAMFFDPTEDKIYDFVDGQKDMKESLLRFIGDPEERIKEDNLRLLRAVRFKNCYNLQYHPDTYQAVKKFAPYVKNVSRERISDELNKMIMGENPGQAFEELFEMDLLEQIIPELCKLKGLAQPKKYHNEVDVWEHSLRSLDSLTEEEVDPNPLRETKPDLGLKWATLLHDIGKFKTFAIKNNEITYPSHAETGADIASGILKRLAFPNSIIKKVNWLIRHHMMLIPLFEMPEGRRRHWFLQPHFEDLLELYRADAMGIIPLDLSAYEELKRLYSSEMAKLKLMPACLVTGNEVMKILKIGPGEKVGKILKEVREKQLDEELTTSRGAKKYIKSKFLSSKNG